MELTAAHYDRVMTSSCVNYNRAVSPSIYMANIGIGHRRTRFDIAYSLSSPDFRMKNDKIGYFEGNLKKFGLLDSYRRTLIDQINVQNILPILCQQEHFTMYSCLEKALIPDLPYADDADERVFTADPMLIIRTALSALVDCYSLLSDVILLAPMTITASRAAVSRSEPWEIHRYGDGFTAHMHTRGFWIPRTWALDPSSIDLAMVLSSGLRGDRYFLDLISAESRALMLRMYGFDRILERRQSLPSSVHIFTLDSNEDKSLGDLVRISVPSANFNGLFLVAKCPRNGTIVEAVAPLSEIDGREIRTAQAAQAWRIGLAAEDYIHPPRRT